MKALLTKLVNKVMKVSEVDKAEQMLNEIRERASWLGVTIQYMDMTHTTGRFGIVASQQFEVEKMMIDMVPGLPAMEQVMTVAHELGHVWQFLGECEGEYAEWLSYNQINSTLLIEEDAWLRSIKILVEVGFDDWMTLKVFAAKKYGSYVLNRYKDHELIKQKVQSFVASLDRQIEKEVRYALV